VGFRIYRLLGALPTNGSDQPEAAGPVSAAAGRSWPICVVGRHKLAETSPCSSIHQTHNLATPSKPRFAYRYPPAANSESCVSSANEIKAPSSEYWLCHDSDGPHCWHINPSISRWVGWRFDRQARLSRNQGRPVATVLVRSTAQRHPKKKRRGQGAQAGRRRQARLSGFPNDAGVPAFGFPCHLMHKSKVDIGESSS